jgi:hypothetical protein
MDNVPALDAWITLGSKAKALGRFVQESAIQPSPAYADCRRYESFVGNALAFATIYIHYPDSTLPLSLLETLAYLCENKAAFAKSEKMP